MHFLFLNQFYPPDVAPTGVMLEAVGAELVRRGHEVTIICEQRLHGHISADCEAKGPKIIETKARWKRGGSSFAKILRYASYYAGVAWKLLRLSSKPNVIVALTTPPYLSLLARAGSRWHGGLHAHWIMDIYPDVMTAHGMLKEGGMAHRILAALGRWGMGGKRNSLILTLGPDMAERVERCMHGNVAVNWVPLWGTSGTTAAPQSVAELREKRGWAEKQTVFLYSGNMGLGHRFEDILQAAIKLSEHAPDSFRFAFYGGGKRKMEIESFALGHAQKGKTSIEVHNYVAREELAAHLSSGDVHLASLDPAWDGMMVPSKLQGIFSAGRPVLFTGSRTCSIGRWIEESGGGWVVEPGDVEGHVQALMEALQPAERQKRGDAAQRFSSTWFDLGTNVTKIANLLTKEETSS